MSGRESMNGSSSQAHFVLAKDAAMLKGHCWDEWKLVTVVKCYGGPPCITLKHNILTSCSHSFAAWIKAWEASKQLLVQSQV